MKDLQKRIKDFTDANNLGTSPGIRMLDIVTEVGEVAKEIIKSTDYGTKPFQAREELKPELGDAIFSIAVLANQLNIDLDEAVGMVLEKYERRLQKGSAGSESDK